MIELWNDSVTFRLITVMVPLMTLVIWAFWYLIKSNDKIIDEQRAVKKELLDSQTREEFILAWDHAIQWHKTTWHKNHGSLSMELKGIIEAKKQIYGIE